MGAHDERWLVTGAAGRLGRWLITCLRESCGAESLLALTGQATGAVAGVEFERCDLARPEEWDARVRAFRPTHMLHAGAVTSVAAAHEDPARATAVNVGATERLGEIARAGGARLVFTSTDMVFDGTEAPYGEEAPPRPLSVYGATKAAAESAVLRTPGAVVVRLALLVGPTPGLDDFKRTVASLRAGKPQRVFCDEFRSPLSYEDAARALIGIARSSVDAVLHLGGGERLSRWELARRWAKALGVASGRWVPVSRNHAPAQEPRPADLTFDTGRFRALFPALVPRSIADCARDWRV
ncbi:MAG: NAD(P)-dependent oxidoreductase [Planctomycetota bacterium]